MRHLVVTLAVVAVGCTPKTLRMAEQISHFAADYQPTPGDDMAGPLAELEQRLTAWGVTIGDLPPTVGGVGLASARDRSILLRPGLSPNARFEVLAHEAGHLLQSPGVTDLYAQLFAELVGVGVQRFYGSTTAEKVAARYLASMKHTFPAYQWMKRDIAYAVRCLTGQEPMPQWRDGQ